MGIAHLLNGGGNGSSVVSHLRGQLFAEVDGQPLRGLIGCEGFTIEQSVDDGARWLGRQVMLWTDPTSGAVIDEWDNPLTGERVSVLHDWLDPMNTVCADDSFIVERIGNHAQHVMTRSSVIESPMRPSVFTREVSRLTLSCSELIRAFPTGGAVSIVRKLPWLPWMLMGATPGGLVVHIGGQVVSGGYAALPNHLRSYVQQNRPEFAFVPTKWESPNETSWSLYLKECQPG
jgi:Protein of unknown function (DUF1838)